MAAFPGTIRPEANGEPGLETLIGAGQAVVVCGIVEDAQGRVFLARRRADQALAGKERLLARRRPRSRATQHISLE